MAGVADGSRFDSHAYDTRMVDFLDGQYFFTSFDEVYETFGAMGLQENLLRGIYAYAAPKRLRQRPTETTTVAETPGSNRDNPGFGNKKKEPVWQRVPKCGACCRLNKGPAFPSPDEILDNPADVEKYKSMRGPDGWCIHFEKSTRRCRIYADRPCFCRVEPDIFETLYGIDKKKFNKEACSCCIDTIKAVYGSKSEELNNVKHAIWNTQSQTN